MGNPAQHLTAQLLYNQKEITVADRQRLHTWIIKICSATQFQCMHQVGLRQDPEFHQVIPCISDIFRNFLVFSYVFFNFPDFSRILQEIQKKIKNKEKFRKFLEKPRKFKNSPNLLRLFVIFRKFLEFL